MIKAERCKYASYCKYYRSKDYTCNHGDEAATYCGTYDIFANIGVRKAVTPTDKHKAA